MQIINIELKIKKTKQFILHIEEMGNNMSNLCKLALLAKIKKKKNCTTNT